MPISPNNYAWLDTIGTLPRLVAEARKQLGVIEKPGPGNNGTILGWAHELGGNVEKVFTADSIAWCGLFMAIVAKRAGKTPPIDPLWALNWGKFGEPAGQPALGDVLTFIRPGGGHVAIYIGEDSAAYHVIGGNMTDQVCFDRIDKDRLKAARRTPYMNRPASVKPYVLAAKGGLSSKED